jgi:hypothetical protein
MYVKCLFHTAFNSIHSDTFFLLSASVLVFLLSVFVMFSYNSEIDVFCSLCAVNVQFGICFCILLPSFRVLLWKIASVLWRIAVEYHEKCS